MKGKCKNSSKKLLKNFLTLQRRQHQVLWTDQINAMTEPFHRTPIASFHLVLVATTIFVCPPAVTASNVIGNHVERQQLLQRGHCPWTMLNEAGKQRAQLFLLVADGRSNCLKKNV